MKDRLGNLATQLDLAKKRQSEAVQPVFFRLSSQQDIKGFEELLKSHSDIVVFDELEGQLRELFKIRNPRKKLSEEEYNQYIQDWKNTHNALEYGVWVFYPWSSKMVHILDEEEFIELRTSRNQYKITPQEQKLLAQKRLGIIGLSVGQSVALTLAIERSFGVLKIADFDILELSNLNRIRAGLVSLGNPKTTLVAREIAEIDPFLKVEIYTEGITPDNINDFLTNGGQLDVLIEECDSLDVKLLARIKARELGIPVVMDTSDRGMIDIERFDLEPDRPIFHGLLGTGNPMDLAKMEGIQKVLAFYKLVGGNNISSRLKASYLELGISLTTWPQLASAVGLGGAALADITRKILIGKKVSSGRFYIDMDELIPTLNNKEPFTLPNISKLNEDDIREYIRQFGEPNPQNVALSAAEINSLIEAGSSAPSSGNDQPWLFVNSGNSIYIFHELERTFSFGDYNDIASLQSIGAAIENIYQRSKNLGFDCKIEYLKDPNIRVVARLIFSKSKELKTSPWANYIDSRITNRSICAREEIEQPKITSLSEAAMSIPGFKISFVNSIEDRNKLGQMIGTCDLFRIYNEQGHFDFFRREMRWTEEEAQEKRVGMNINELEIDPSLVPAIRMLEDYSVVKTLESVDGGKGFQMVSKSAAMEASAFGLICAENLDSETLLEAGRSWERLWLEATRLEICLHPMVSPLYMFPRIESGEGFSAERVEELKEIKQQLLEIFAMDPQMEPLFMFRIFKSDKKPKKSYRLEKEKIFLKLN